MKSLPGTNGKTIINKLFIPGINSSLYNFIAAIKSIIEQRMSDIFHVHSYLVCTAGFQNTFHQCYIIKTFNDFIMSDCIFTMISFGVGFEQFSESKMTTNMSNNSSFVIYHITPN